MLGPVSEVATTGVSGSAVDAVTPFHDPSRRRRFVKIAGWLAGILIALVVLRLLGVDVIGWLQDFWTQVKDIPVGYLSPAPRSRSLQTTLQRARLLRDPHVRATRAACSSGRSSRPTRSACR